MAKKMKVMKYRSYNSVLILCSGYELRPKADCRLFKRNNCQTGRNICPLKIWEPLLYVDFSNSALFWYRAGEIVFYFSFIINPHTRYKMRVATHNKCVEKCKGNAMSWNIGLCFTGTLSCFLWCLLLFVSLWSGYEFSQFLNFISFFHLQ